MTNREAMNKIKEKIKELPKESKFILRDLFSEEEWKHIEDVRSLGKEFKKEVMKGEIKIVKFKEKKSNNHSFYIKK